LMRENGLNARRRRKFIRTVDSRHTLPVCPNVLSQQFHAEWGGEKWVSSYQRYAVTYLRTGGGWVYLTWGRDRYDRKVSGWALSADRETAHTAIPAVEMAFSNRKARTGLIFHSDREVPYCVASFREALKTRCPSVRRSMSRTGNCSGLRVCGILF
jgi:transposase InsO family protein